MSKQQLGYLGPPPRHMEGGASVWREIDNFLGIKSALNDIGSVFTGKRNMLGSGPPPMPKKKKPCKKKK